MIAGVYTTFVMLMNTWSVMLTVLVLNLHHRNECRPIPAWLRIVAFEGLARLLCMYTQQHVLVYQHRIQQRRKSSSPAAAASQSTTTERQRPRHSLHEVRIPQTYLLTYLLHVICHLSASCWTAQTARTLAMYSVQYIGFGAVKDEAKIWKLLFKRWCKINVVAK